MRGYQVSFSVKTSQKSPFQDLNLALVFIATTKNFQDKYILTYFGGSHLRACVATAEWFKAPVLET